MLEDLKKEVCQANLDLVKHNLVILTWGNVSAIDRDKNLVVIKPSGVAYSDLTPEKMTVVDLDGNIVEGDLNPSSDTPTHLILYKAFSEAGGITHTHSPKATSYAQSCRPIPCYGTTHADHFYGDVPVTRILTENEVTADYEKNTGNVIVERFEDLNPMDFPAVLVANHGPFTWGKSAAESVKNSVALEMIAQMALDTELLNKDISAVNSYILDKHFCRKHGPDAYYGQS
ncbi:MAG: L-ribulose-5-phosphate 4-epimerase [Planctomycetota bacterium]